MIAGLAAFFYRSAPDVVKTIPALIPGDSPEIGD
jgi:hypothetical protein